MNYEVPPMKGVLMWVFRGKIPELALLLPCLKGFLNKTTLLINLKSLEFLLLNVLNGTVDIKSVLTVVSAWIPPGDQRPQISATDKESEERKKLEEHLAEEVQVVLQTGAGVQLASSCLQLRAEKSELHW